jgi:hypothetical protein
MKEINQYSNPNVTIASDDDSVTPEEVDKG